MSIAHFSKTIQIIGDTLTLDIVHNLATEPMRFCQLQRATGDANPVTLTTRLKTLERENIIEKHDNLYKLSQKGSTLVPIIKEIGAVEW